MSNLYTFYKATCTKYTNNMLFYERYSYGQTLDLALSRAAYLQKYGILKGDVIAILAANSPEWCITYMAITACGAIALPLDPNLPPGLYQQMLDIAGAKILFTDHGPNIQSKGVTTIDIRLENALEKTSRGFCEPAVNDSDPASLLFTSGTTGRPKIVSLSQSNIVQTSIGSAEHIGLDGQNIFLAVLPLYHVYGFVANFSGPLAIGGSILFQRSLKGSDIIQTLAENPINIFPGVPQLWEMFLGGVLEKLHNESKLKYKFFLFVISHTPALHSLGLSFVTRRVFAPIHNVFGSQMKYLLSGGAPLGKRCFQYFTNMGFKFIEGYGLTETTGPICVSALGNTRPGSIGKPLPGNELQIRRTADDGVGEIWLRGSAVMPGYYQNHNANLEAFDPDGWFDSGDMGYLDENGELHISGRSKNVIVLSSGKNVYPEELEDYYCQSRLIFEICVFGAKKPEGESAYAVIVPKNKYTDSYHTIREELNRMNQGLPAYQAVNSFALSYDELPKTSTKKVIAAKVRELLESGYYQTEETGRPVETELIGTTPENEHILSIIKTLAHKDKLYDSQTFSELGIDSLKIIELIVLLEEKLGINIDEDSFIRANNLQELLKYLETCPKGVTETLQQEVLQGDITTRTRAFNNPLLSFGLTLIRLVSKLFWRLKIINPDNLDLNNKVIVANHQSFLDALWILSMIPKNTRKNIYLIGKKDLSFLKYIFPGLPLIFVERDGNFIPSLKAGADVL
ncbi:MAG: AMP-binding protein, partial [Candidatus Margulisiibacteriota bacterium]